MEKYGPLSPEANFLSELYAKVKQAEEIPDRRTIYSIEVTENLSGQKNKHWRWAGTLAQFEKDVKEYLEIHCLHIQLINEINFYRNTFEHLDKAIEILGNLKK
jgi:hypothetical protein